MATFNTEKFIQGAKEKGFDDNQIAGFLQQKGINPAQPKQDIADPGQLNFFQRLKAGFGTEATKEKARQAEAQAGLRGKFDIGDIADIAGEALPFIGGFVGGAAGPVGVGAGVAAGESVRRTVGQLLGVRGDVTPLQEATGPIVEGVGAGLTAGAIDVAGRALKPVLSGVKKTAGGVGKLAKETVFGTQRAEALTVARQNPFFGAFRTGASTIDDVANQTRQAGATFQTKSIDTFQKALSEAKGQIPKKDVVKSINNTIRESLDLAPKGPLSKAIEGTKLTSQEVRNVRNLIKTINKHKDWSVQGVQQLKQKVNGFFKTAEGFNDSNKLISLIAGKNGILNKVSIEKAPQLKTALAQASDDINLLQKLKINVLGKNKLNVELTPTRLKSLAKGLADPNTKQATIALVKELEKNLPVSQRTLLQQLEAFNASQILGKDIPGLKSPFETIAGLTTRGAGRLAEAVPQIPQVNIPQGFRQGIGTAGKLGLFEALKGGLR